MQWQTWPPPQLTEKTSSHQLRLGVYQLGCAIIRRHTHMVWLELWPLTSRVPRPNFHPRPAASTACATALYGYIHESYFLCGWHFCVKRWFYQTSAEVSKACCNAYAGSSQNFGVSLPRAVIHCNWVVINMHRFDICITSTAKFNHNSTHCL